MSWWRVVVMVGLMGWSSAASAVPGLGWKWAEGEEREYLLASTVQVAELLLFTPATDTRIRVYLVDTQLHAKCSPRPGVKSKTSVDLICKVADVAWKVGVVQGDEGHVIGVLDEFRELLLAEGAFVQVGLSHRGRVQSTNIQGIPSGQRRANLMRETMRNVLDRTFSALDLHMPKKGDDGAKPWDDNQSKLPSMPSMAGVIGSVPVVHQVASVEGPVVTIESKGKGIIGRADSSALYDVVVSATGRFDTERGLLLDRSWKLNAAQTATTHLAGTLATVHGGSARYLAPGTQVAELGPNEEVNYILSP